MARYVEKSTQGRNLLFIAIEALSILWFRLRKSKIVPVFIHRLRNKYSKHQKQLHVAGIYLNGYTIHSLQMNFSLHTCSMV